MSRSRLRNNRTEDLRRVRIWKGFLKITFKLIWKWKGYKRRWSSAKGRNGTHLSISNKVIRHIKMANSVALISVNMKQQSETVSEKAKAYLLYNEQDMSRKAVCISEIPCTNVNTRNFCSTIQWISLVSHAMEKVFNAFIYLFIFVKKKKSLQVLILLFLVLMELRLCP